MQTSLGHRYERVLNRHLTGNTFDYKQIIAIISPVFIDQAFLIMMTLLNTAMVSSSGVYAVSAVSMVDSLNIFIACIFIALATGGAVIVAQYKGSGNDAMVSKVVPQAITVVTAVSIIISVLLILFHSSVLNLLFGKAEAAVMHNAKIYLIGSCISFPFFAVYHAVHGVLRGVAETKACLKLSLIMNVIFLCLNVLFILILEMGVLGLVFALVLARIAGTVSSFIYLLRFSPNIMFKLRDLVAADLPLIKKMLFIGTPFAAEQLFFNGGKLLTQTFIVQLGTLALTVFAVTNVIIMVFQIGGVAISQSTVTIVGQSLGRGDLDDAKKFTRALIGLSTLFFLLKSVILLPLMPWIVAMFAPPPEIVPTIYLLVFTAAVAQPLFWSASFILPSALRAAGDAKFTSYTAMATMWLFRITLGYVLGISFGFGIFGFWLAMVIEWGIRGFLFAWRFRGDKWYQHRLI